MCLYKIVGLFLSCNELCTCFAYDNVAERDGVPSSANDIFLTTGASEGISVVLEALISHDRVGVWSTNSLKKIKRKIGGSSLFFAHASNDMLKSGEDGDGDVIVLLLFRHLSK